MLFREAFARRRRLPSPRVRRMANLLPTANPPKSFKEPVPAKKPKLSDQGLYLFSLFYYSPKYNNILPFYFHTGLVYKGLIPTRDDDQLMAAFGFGQYSFFNIEVSAAERQRQSAELHRVLEVDYRIQINKWAYLSALHAVHHSAQRNRRH